MYIIKNGVHFISNLVKRSHSSSTVPLGVMLDGIWRVWGNRSYADDVITSTTITGILKDSHFRVFCHVGTKNIYKSGWFVLFHIRISWIFLTILPLLCPVLPYVNFIFRKACSHPSQILSFGVWGVHTWSCPLTGIFSDLTSKMCRTAVPQLTTNWLYWLASRAFLLINMRHVDMGR